MFSLQSTESFAQSTRRQFLRAGFLGVSGLSLADVLRHEAQAAPAGHARNREKSVILLFDHWPSAMSILISGGGMPMGQVIGSTDAIGARPASRPFDPHDFLATIYKFLGINHELQLPDPAGRPISLTNGKPIAELF